MTVGCECGLTRAIASAESSCPKNNSRLGSPVRLSWTASCSRRSSAVLLSVRPPSADDAHHLAVGADDRRALKHEPDVMSVRRAKPEIERHASAALFEHRVETSRIAVAVERMENVELERSRSLEHAALDAEMLLGSGLT